MGRYFFRSSLKCNALLHKHLSKMAVLDYVSADVSSDYCLHLMTYYKRCSKMGSPHYAFVDNSSDDLSE
jgi:hypothetical protein